MHCVSHVAAAFFIGLLIGFALLALWGLARARAAEEDRDRAREEVRHALHVLRAVKKAAQARQEIEALRTPPRPPPSG